MGFVRVAAGLFLLALVTPPFFLAALLLLPSRVARIKLCNLYGKIVGRGITACAGVTPHVSHPERLDGSMPAIYVANHTSTLDAFLSIWLCPFGACGVMKKEVVRTPFFGQLAVLSGHLLIDRARPESAVEALRDTGELVRRHGLGVWIMPEGTRSKDGRLLPFKKGFVHLAIATGLPVVPVVLHGVHKNWKKGDLMRFEPMDVDVEVLPPVDTKGWRQETAAAHAAHVHGLFAAALRPDQKPLEPDAGAAAEDDGPAAAA